MDHFIATAPHREPWNKGKIVGQKAPLKLKDIWAIRVRLQLSDRLRDLALFDLAIDSKLRACDLVKLRVRDVSHGDRIPARAIVMQQKTQRPVQFEITEQTRDAVYAWIRRASLRSEDFLFPSRVHESPHLSTRQYARIVGSWVREIGLDPAAYGTHTLRRTKASLIYRRTKNLRAVQLLLGHTKLESTVRYLGIEVDDALEMTEQTEV
jgi:integrase